MFFFCCKARLALSIVDYARSAPFPKSEAKAPSEDLTDIVFFSISPDYSTIFKELEIIWLNLQFFSTKWNELLFIGYFSYLIEYSFQVLVLITCVFDLSLA